MSIETFVQKSKEVTNVGFLELAMTLCLEKYLHISKITSSESQLLTDGKMYNDRKPSETKCKFNNLMFLPFQSPNNWIRSSALYKPP